MPSPSSRSTRVALIEAPSQTQTFLFADLAGFTALTEVHGDEQAADLVEAFCERARATFPQHDAEEVKAIGDALMIRLPDSTNGVRLALVLVDEIGGEHGFPALRVGLHSGPAVERGGDWFGATVNLAARVSELAIAGEVLVTKAVHDSAAERLPGLEFQARGRRDFKNVREAVEVFAVSTQGERSARLTFIDPVCQMAVDPDRAAERAVHRGQDHYFCSEACAEAFKADPPSYSVRPSSREELRVSDEARDRALALLRRGYEHGRISGEELEERTAHALAARTRGELSVVLHDLPGYRRFKGARRRRKWMGIFVPGRRRRS